jgi:uncharacterized protein (DUF362 family)
MGGRAVVYLVHPTAGHREGVREALSLLEEGEDLGALVRGERVLVKPNCVSTQRQLASTHVEALDAVLEVLAAHDPKRLIVGEGSAGDTFRAFENFGYLKLKRKYDVELLDLNKDRSVKLTIYDRDARPFPVPVARTALESVRVSVAIPKTHDTVIITCALKNLVMGSVQQPHKLRVHQGYPAINLNLALLGLRLAPHLSVVDGFVGMEGDGPVGGSPVEHRIALAGTDPVAVDVTVARLMGFSPAEIGYLQHTARLGLGVADPAGIEVAGALLDAAVRAYRPHRTYRKQLNWKPSPAFNRVLEGLSADP